MPIIPIAIKVAQTVFKYRRQIYSVITAQDRYIKGAFVGTRVSKAAQYGWRSGAAAGGLLGSTLINDADDSPGNAIQKAKPKQTTTSKPYQTRRRQTRSNRSRYCRPYESRSRY